LIEELTGDERLVMKDELGQVPDAEPGMADT
jgi:hypothetical protein